MSRGRTIGAHAANPISFFEIEAWARLTRSHPSPFEVRLLRSVDDAYLAKLAKKKPGAIDVSDAAGMADFMADMRARTTALFNKKAEAHGGK